MSAGLFGMGTTRGKGLGGATGPILGFDSSKEVTFIFFLGLDGGFMSFIFFFGFCLGVSADFAGFASDL